MAGVKQPEPEPGRAPPVVICERTLAVSVMTERVSKDIEKLLDSRSVASATLKALEKSPLDGFSPRLNICKGNLKRQGASVTTCISALVQFVRGLLSGQAPSTDGGPGASGSTRNQALDLASPQQIPGDTTSQRSSCAAVSESNHNVSVSERPDALVAQQVLRQQEQRQKEVVAVLESSLGLLKTTRWATIARTDRETILGLLAVAGGWFGSSRLGAGAQVQVQVNGCWTEATVVDEGFGRKRISVLLKEDASLQLVRVPHSQVRPCSVQIDEAITSGLNLEDLCEVIVFLHSQLQDGRTEQVDSARPQVANVAPTYDTTLNTQTESVQVLLQMLLKVCSQLDWSKINKESSSFRQLPQILLQLTNSSATQDGQNHEDKSEAFLEKQLLESWERIIDRQETRNLEIYTPRQFSPPVDSKERRARVTALPGKGEAEEELQ
jgi:hypothetical protein